MPRLYDEFAPWWPLISPPSEYAEEAAFYARTLEAASEQPVRTVLELGSGGGNNASHLKERFAMVLVEPSDPMREVSRALNPDCEHVEGDMRTVRLAREFDAVFVHDAVCYMTTEPDLRKAIETVFVHCKAGGVALIAPDFVRENFKSSIDCGGSDDGPRGARYLAWSWDPDPSDSTYVVDYAYLLRMANGHVRAEPDRHIEGLFARADWLRLLTEAGFLPNRVSLEHTQLEPDSREVFVAKKP